MVLSMQFASGRQMPVDELHLPVGRSPYLKPCGRIHKTHNFASVEQRSCPFGLGTDWREDRRAADYLYYIGLLPSATTADSRESLTSYRAWYLVLHKASPHPAVLPNIQTLRRAGLPASDLAHCCGPTRTILVISPGTE